MNLNELNFSEKIDFEKQSADDEKFVKNYPACKYSFGTFLSTLEHGPIHGGEFFMLLVVSASFRSTIRVLNGLDPDQDRCVVGPDLGSDY